MSAVAAVPNSSQAKKSRWRETLVLLALLALALGLRLYDLTGESLWYDETYSVWIADMDIASLRILWEMPVQFPAYYLLLHAWVRTFGLSDLSVRMVGALLGALTVVPMYLLGRALFGRKVGAIAAFLLAINPYHIWYSQEVRMHSWAVLFTLISLYAFWRLLHKGHWGWWALHLVFTALTFHLHYYIGFMIIAQNLYLLGYLWRQHGSPFNRTAWRMLRVWLLEQALLLLIMVPGIIVFLVKLLELREWDWLAQRHGPPGVGELISLFTDYTLGSDFPASRAVLWAVLAFVGLLAAWGIVASLRRRTGDAVWKPRLQLGTRKYPCPDAGARGAGRAVGADVHHRPVFHRLGYALPAALFAFLSAAGGAGHRRTAAQGSVGAAARLCRLERRGVGAHVHHAAKRGLAGRGSLSDAARGGG